MACGESLILLANTFALCLADGASDEELGIMSSFFSLVGDQLALITACRVKIDTGSKNGESETKKVRPGDEESAEGGTKGEDCSFCNVANRYSREMGAHPGGSVIM